MEIRWLKVARADLKSVHAYIAQDSEAAADRQILKISASLQPLLNFPEAGRSGRVEGTRELIVAGTPYIVVYRIRRKSIHVLAVLHGARRWPSSFKH
jgi:toxin ParE1/3/4